MILVDTNVVTTFAKVGKLPLLFAATANTLYISPNVYRELQEGVVKGYAVLQAVLDLLAVGQIQVITLTEADQSTAAQLPLAAAKGEVDSLAYCLNHEALFLTNDRRAGNLGSSLGVTCLTLATILRRLWRSGKLSKTQVTALIREIEQAEGTVLREREAILQN